MLIELSADVYYTIYHSNFPPGYDLDIERDSQLRKQEIIDEIDEKYFIQDEYAPVKSKKGNETLSKESQVLHSVVSRPSATYVIIIRLTATGDTKLSTFRFLYEIAKRGLAAIKKEEKNIECSCGLSVTKTSYCPL